LHSTIVVVSWDLSCQNKVLVAHITPFIQHDHGLILIGIGELHSSPVPFLEPQNQKFTTRKIQPWS
jgi:hypothetical protein